MPLERKTGDGMEMGWIGVITLIVRERDHLALIPTNAGPRVRACLEECRSTILCQSMCPQTLQQVAVKKIMRMHLRDKTQILLINSV